ncbi:MAG TPA: universal stress protein [Candidatus Angelobacter sp.]|jgi:nucleotide-binding universal stress UspA family protein|nr:universal stress protein [Candidatus Angelobacter sp.]
MATANIVVSAVHLKNILFATDFSDYARQALPYATDLARKFGSKVHLCHVVTPSQLMIGAPEAAPYLYEAQHRTSEEELAIMTHSPELKGIKTHTILASGMLEDELMTAMSENQIDLIVVGTHGRTGLRRLVLGSAAEEICRIATCPVLTVGPDAGPRKKEQFRRILVPTDFSEESTAILPYILDIAREYGSTITFLHVIPLDASLNINARLLAEDARNTLKKVFAKECADHRPQFLIEFGHPAEAILRVAKESEPDLIAMGIRHAFTPGIRLRSGVAYQVMAGAQCPVLTCR